MAYHEKATARKQIIARKARIADIDRILVQPAQMGPYGKPLVMGSQSRVRLTRERVQLLYENELEEQVLAGPSGRDDGAAGAKLAPISPQANPIRKMPTQKKTDLSRYFDGARLTPRQRDCCSLKLEYGWKTTQIEKHLGISRKTISGHILAATRKFEIAKLKEKGRSQAARTNPGRLNRNQ